MMTILGAVCLAACGVLVYAEWKRAASVRVVAKVVASLAFLAVGVVARPAHDTYGAWIVAGLALGVAGDIALLAEGKRAFLAGLGAFLLGHLAYVIAMAQVRSPATWIDTAGIWAMLPVVIAAIALVTLWSRLGSMRIPVIAYVLVIVTMVIGAFALRHVDRALGAPQAALMATIVEPRVPAREMFLAGAVLFFASDLAVARDKFVGTRFSNKLWGLPAYYAGQLLIAWSLSA